jgi:parvulin-like peptidyl-prolyl isomerase
MSHFLLGKRLSRAGWLISAVTIIGACWAIRHWAGLESATARTPATPAGKSASGGKQSGSPTPTKEQPIVAVVNGETITRKELANECLRHHGKEVLESLVNRRLIDKHCRDQGIAVTAKEVDDEIDRIARKFSLPKDQYLSMLSKERGIKPAQYGRDIVWPTLALRKLAAAKLTVSKQELAEAYESQFGPAVKARLIAVGSQQKAKKLLAQAKANPEEFGALARNHSDDINSASANGLIQPIRKHLGDPQLEQVAFNLKPGEISPIVEVGNQFILLKCDAVMDAVEVDHKRYDPLLIEAIKDRKLRSAATETFQALQSETKVENVMNDPAKSKQMPGVAALVNGEPITLAELADQCVERHGKEVLEGTINRHLLEQSIKRRKLTITEDDLRDEVARAAISMGKQLPNGQPDIEGWIKTVTETQGISEELYLHDAVWPSVAVKKIVGDDVKITEEDLNKGFEANYGPRVRCRAIVLNNQRKAQEVWDMARQNLTEKYFGDLAEQYSIEANSRSLRGEVPPIQKHSGQPIVEREAFQLKPGELSGVIQAGENFVILFCQGRTKPVGAKFEEVRDQLYEDIHEKKLRLAMGQAFEKMKSVATIDNYLAGTSQSPKTEKELLMDDTLGGEPPASARGATARSAPKR